MAVFKKPIFTEAEIAETESSHLFVGYHNGSLIAGHDFARKPFKGEKTNIFVAAKEKLNGTAKKRQCHAQINSFGWARFDKNKLAFGVKFSTSNGLTKVGEKVIKKYEQLLGYLLEQAGWKDIKVVKDEYLSGTNYVVPLDNPENIKLLYTLSPSIGFYYKVKRPDIEDMNRLEMQCMVNGVTRKQGKTR